MGNTPQQDMGNNLQQGDGTPEQRLTNMQPQQTGESIIQAWDDTAKKVKTVVAWEKPQVRFTDWASI